jgi:hypothetical protein
MRDIHNRLSKYIEDCIDRDYLLGRHDCGTFAAEWGDMLAGSSMADDLREQYTTIDQCHKMLGKSLHTYGIRTLQANGFQSMNDPILGDIALLSFGFGIVTTLGDKRALIAPVEGAGMLLLPMSHGKGFYRCF